MEKNKKIVVFDFDGVLVDSEVFHREKIELLYNVEISDEIFRDHHKGNVFSKSDLLGHVEWDDYFSKVRAEMAQLPLVEGMEQILAMCSPAHMISSCSEENIAAFFVQNNVEHFFDCVYGMESERSKEEKFHLLCDACQTSSEDLLFITDTLGDIHEAHNIGVETIGVTWGFHDRAALAEGEPQHIVDTPEELHQIVSSYTTR